MNADRQVKEKHAVTNLLLNYYYMHVCLVNQKQVISFH